MRKDTGCLKPGKIKHFHRRKGKREGISHKRVGTRREWANFEGGRLMYLGTQTHMAVIDKVV